VTDHELFWHSATEMAELVRTRAVSPVELVDACLARLDAVNPRLNAVVTVAPDAAERARLAEEDVARGRPLGPLHGVPLTVKDSFDTAGLRTTRGSLLFRDHVPREDAEAVRRLRAAGAILIGKTNTPEFTLWTQTDNLVCGPTFNPWSLDRSPGGSSGGEAAAIGSGISPLGLGSDLAGSIRLPAHYCGVVGFKPTHGAVPLTGHFPPILDGYTHAGPLARTVEDARLAYHVLAGRDEAAAAPPPPPPRTVGVLAGECFCDVTPEVAEALELASGAFPSRTRAAIDLTGFLEVSLILFAGDSARFLGSLTPAEAEQLHPVLRARLSRPLPGEDDVAGAQAALARMHREMAALLERFDVLLAPVSPSAAPEAGSEPTVNGRPLGPREALAITQPFSLGGHPVSVVPAMLDGDGMPLGVQVIGRHGDDERVLAAAAAIQRERPAFRPRLEPGTRA
jgi:Asp-tRNA(Asn)/Glu-tRNA(Gln) amidotransferase A subunit family amidase